MTEGVVVLVSGDNPHLVSADPLPCEVVTNDVADVPKGNKVTKIDAWNKPHISVKQPDRNNEKIRFSFPPPPPPLEIETNSFKQEKKELCVSPHTRVYPKTPPASYKFHSPSIKHEKGDSVLREEEEEDESDGDDGSEEERGQENDGKKQSEENTGCLQVVLSTNPRSHSLPVGIKMTVNDLNRISSNSDETVDSEGGSPQEKRKRSRAHDHLCHEGQLDSAGSDLSQSESSDESSSDGAGDEEKIGSIIPSPSLEDDIFIDGELMDMQEEANTKLSNWAYNDFVPACRQLLSQCCEDTTSALVKSANIQAGLRSLSNAIAFFCTEQQQRLSQVFQLKPIRGTSQSSTSMLTFPRPAKNFLSDSSDDRSYAVKVLRSASQSLITPLLVEASQKGGFTPSLHQSIIKALQKITWKVEACISFSNPSHSVEIHSQIFDDQPIKNVKELMIQALPPAEPKLQTVPLATKMRKSSEPSFATEFSPPVPMRRGQSVKDSLGSGEQSNTDITVTNVLSDLQSISESDKDDEVWREGSVGAETLGGAEEERERDRLANAGEVHDTDHDEVIEADEGDVQSPLREDVFCEGTPNLPRRERIATEGEADLMSKVTLTRKKNFGSIPNLEQESSDVLTQSGSSSRGEKERYFRPRAFRRTTISLSKREVQKLGLTVAKRVDESILDDIRSQKAKEVEQKKSQDHQRSSKSEEKAPPPTAASEGIASPGQVLQLHPRTRSDHDIESPHDLDRVGDSLHNKLTKEFRHIRSASLSDLLDSDVSTPDPSNSDRESDVFSPQPNQRLELVALKNSLENKRLLHIDTNVRASSPSTPSPNFEKSYVHVPFHREMQVHPTSPSTGDWVIVEAEKTKKSSVKATVKKSISTSGKFAHSLLKTARSLRHGSKLQQQKLCKSHSAADLLDESSVFNSQQQLRPPAGSNLSRMSFSINPSSSSYDVSTLPTRNSRMDTLARIISRRNKPRSRSFGKSDSHVSNGLSDLSSNERFNESIETVSRNAIRSMAIESEEQLLISVDVATKLQRKEIRYRKKKESSSDPWFQITVSTNIREFGRRDYTILRRFKEIKKLIDSLLSSSHGAIDLPRPDKKSGVKKKQMKFMEDVLRSIAGNTQLRSSATFVTFLMPDDEFGSFTENDRSEVSFERLMTFYTPDISSGPPGSFPSVQIVPHEHVPASSSRSPVPPRKSSLTGGHKKGSMHYMKKDGKDDTSTYVIQEEGEDALIVACEDDHYVVVAGTFEKLVEQLACEEKPDARFVTTFLLGYRHFATTLEFLTTLLERFHMTVPPNPTEEEMAYAEKWSYVIQLRVLDILTYWMKKCWPDIYRHPPVLEKVKEFATSLKATDDHNFQYAGNNIEKIITEKMVNSVQYCLPPEASSPGSLTTSDSPTSTAREHYFSSARRVRPPSHAHQEQAKRSMAAGISPRSVSTLPSSPSQRTGNGSYGMVDIYSLPAIRLARQLTLIELDFLRAIDIHELVVYTWDPNTPENKPYRRNLDAFIERFNKVSYWVASEICCVEDVRLRGILLEKFIEVAKYCHELKNYNTTISVLSGLSLAAVRRLKRSWDLVNEKTKKWFNKLQPLTSPATNHSNYRRTLATVHRTDACIPYLGVFMRDLTFFNDGNNKRLKNGLYNFSKLRTMVHKFEELKRYQRSKYTFPTEYKIQECCRNLWCFTDSELYDTSLRAEPREETDL